MPRADVHAAGPFSPVAGALAGPVGQTPKGAGIRLAAAHRLPAPPCRWISGAKTHPDLERSSVLRSDPYSVGVERDPVKGDGRHATADPLGILYDDVHFPLFGAHPRFEALPSWRDARVDAQLPLLPSEPKDALHPEPPSPGSRARVPAPPAATLPGGTGTDVAGEDVWLHAIATHLVAGRRC